MSIEILSGSLHVDVFYEHSDSIFDDNICVSLKEFCPEDEKILYAGETNIYVTAEQARGLAKLLLKAADLSSHATR